MLNISLDELVLELGSEVAQQVVCRLHYRVGAPQDAAQVDQERGQVLPSRHYLHNESSDGVVEVHYLWLVVPLIGILLVGVLVGVVVGNGAVLVPGRHNVEVVVDGPPLRLNDCLVLEQVECRLGVPALDGVEVVLIAEVELVDDMAGIETAEVSLHLHLHEVVEVSVAAHVEVPRHFLHSKGSD